jgi:hypothetical protein
MRNIVACTAIKSITHYNESDAECISDNMSVWLDVLDMTIDIENANGWSEV